MTYVTCGLTACTPGSAPGPTLGIEYGKAFTFTFILPSQLLQSTSSLCSTSLKHLLNFKTSEVQNINDTTENKSAANIHDSGLPFVLLYTKLARFGLALWRRKNASDAFLAKFFFHRTSPGTTNHARQSTTLIISRAKHTSTVITDIIGLVLSDQQAEFLVTENQTKLFSLTKNPAASNFKKFPEHSKSCY